MWYTHRPTVRTRALTHMSTDAIIKYSEQTQVMYRTACGDRKKRNRLYVEVQFPSLRAVQELD